MKTFFHVLVGSANPRDGGMEESAARIAGHFMNMGRTRVAIYTRRADAVTRPSDLRQGIEHICLWPQMQSIIASLSGDEIDTRGELYRVAKMCFAQEVHNKMLEAADLRHIIVSFYASSTGYIAQHAASELRIPHIASVRGTDFHKDFFNPYRFSGIEFVSKHANYLVTTNENQAQILRNFVPDATHIKTIYNSVSSSLPSRLWTSTRKGSIDLVCDSGFSYKKGTHLLIESFLSLAASDATTRLTIAGEIDRAGSLYWGDLIREAQERLGNRLSIVGHLPKDELIQLFYKSDIFVSSSLGEGCSNSQLLALAIGMPIVATRTGALPEIAPNSEHVRFCNPGSADELKSTLQEMIGRLRDGALNINELQIHEWRKLAHSDRERYQWEQVVANVLPKRDSVKERRQGRVLFFVHDGTGLGHLRRVSRLAACVQGPCASLVISGHRQASFIVPPECELVHIPSLDSLLPNKSRYWGRKPFLDISMKEALALRKEILHAAVNAFNPDVIVVDYLPLGKHAELADVVRETSARLYFIMRGVLDHPDNVRLDLLGGSGEATLENRYDRLFVAADKKICDVVKEYGLSEVIAAKTDYIGYISEPVAPHVLQQTRTERGIASNEQWVVCSAGGGALGEKLIEECVTLPERFPGVFFDIITGPRTSKQWTFLSSDVHVNGKVRFHRECNVLARLHAAADVVVCAGGYNSLVEAMEGRARVITCPVQLRTNDEQFIHGSRLATFYPLRMITDLHQLEFALQCALTDAKDESLPPPPRSVLSFDGALNFRRVLLDDLGLNVQDGPPHVRR